MSAIIFLLLLGFVAFAQSWTPPGVQCAACRRWCRPCEIDEGLCWECAS